MPAVSISARSMVCDAVNVLRSENQGVLECAPAVPQTLPVRCQWPQWVCTHGFERHFFTPYASALTAGGVISCGQSEWILLRRKKQRVISVVPAAGQQVVPRWISTSPDLGVPVRLLQRSGRRNGTVSFRNLRSLRSVQSKVPPEACKFALLWVIHVMLLASGDESGHQMRSLCVQASWMQLDWIQNSQPC